MFDFISQFIGQAFDQTGISAGRSQMVLSLLSNNSDTGIAGDTRNNLLSMFTNTNALKPLLKNFFLTKLYISVYSSTIKDIISKSPFEVKVKGENAGDHVVLQKAINNFLQEVRFKDFILNNLDDALYEGSCAEYCTRDKVTRGWKSIPLKRRHDLVQVLDYGEIKWYIMKQTSPNTTTSDSAFMVNFTGTNPRISDAKNILYYAFGPKPIKQLSKKDLKNTKNPKPLDDTFENNFVIKLQYVQGTGILDDVLALLFLFLLYWLMCMLLMLKNILRPDVMMARIDDSGLEDITQIGSGLRNIESMLNNTSGLVTFSGTDPFAIITLLYSAILNSVKVVPSIVNYTELEKLEYPDLTNKLQQLFDGMNNIRDMIANILGIPSELSEGAGNRWEVIQRSSRFMSAITAVLEDISRSIKGKVIQYLHDTFGKNLVYEDLELTLDTTNILFNQEYNSKQVLISDKVGSIARIMSDAAGIASDGTVDRRGFFGWLKKQLKTLDPEIPEFINSSMEDFVDSTTENSMLQSQQEKVQQRLAREAQLEQEKWEQQWQQQYQQGQDQQYQQDQGQQYESQGQDQQGQDQQYQQGQDQQGQDQQYQQSQDSQGAQQQQYSYREPTRLSRFYRRHR